MFSLPLHLWFAVNATDVYFFGNELLAYSQIRAFPIPLPQLRSTAQRSITGSSPPSSPALSPIVCVCVCEWVSQDFQELETHIIWAVDTKKYLLRLIYFFFEKKKNLVKSGQLNTAKSECKSKRAVFAVWDVCLWNHNKSWGEIYALIV